MLRIINAPILVGLMKQAALEYIYAGKPVPQTTDELETLMLTVITEKEFQRLHKMPGLQEAITEAVTWAAHDERVHGWFANCWVGQMYEEAKKKDQLG